MEHTKARDWIGNGGAWVGRNGNETCIPLFSRVTMFHRVAV